MKAFDLVYASELGQKIEESHAVLIDIRDRESYQKERWPGAINIPYDELEKRIRYLPKKRRLILYCEHGGGSMQMARTLGQEGYQVSTVVGGYEAMKKVQEKYFKNGRNV